ncbi:hypothetical protein [Bosea vaviloviae]|uniref:Uncharacterized protein n=1 Tax=Bosea vaviloviae TaxID=1526658 RepID=A0A1D7U2W0_9HYPH|nr:hypothetical protein [Bosea vaviloviae]AOO81716.1 hypothetical protein BHK69_15780 [Bosea vaviloviae]
MWKRLRPMGVLLVSCLTAGPLAAEPAQSWALWVVKPDRPGHLESCASLRTVSALSASTMLPGGRTPLRLEQPLSIRWQGGYLAQPGWQGEHATERWNAFDSCFLLSVRGAVVAAGAVLRQESARLLRFDTLVIQSDKAGAPLSLSLLPAFPAEIAQPVSPAWSQALTPLSKASAPVSR